MNNIKNDFGSKQNFSKYSNIYSCINENLDALFEELELNNKKILLSNDNYESDILKDVNESLNINFGSKSLFGKYSGIYPYSNENLDVLFNNLDLKDKEVLSVAGSGDHSFYSYNKGACNVDLFDVNLLAKYYYYLRIWIIKNYNSFYFDTINKFKNYNEFSRYFGILFNLVNPTSIDEEEAHEYWKLLYNMCSLKWENYGFGYYLRNKLFRADTKRINWISDLSVIKDKLANNNSGFYNCDITGNQTGIDKVYDVIFLSNIFEYVDDEESIRLKNNICRLLKDDGYIVLSNVKGNLSQINESLLSDVFSFEKLPYVRNMNGFFINSGVVLTKKRG